MTMLAIKDKDGFVAGSVPGLARLAVVSREDVLDAIRVLQMPDPDSQTKLQDGRRIEEVNGGWKIINHELFQKKMKEISTKVHNAKRQRDFRSRKLEKPLKGEVETISKLNNGGITQEQADEAASITREKLHD